MFQKGLTWCHCSFYETFLKSAGMFDPLDQFITFVHLAVCLSILSMASWINTFKKYNFDKMPCVILHKCSIYKHISMPSTSHFWPNFFTIQQVTINNHKPNVHNTTHICHWQGQTSMCHSSEDRLLHHMLEQRYRRQEWAELANTSVFHPGDPGSNLGTGRKIFLFC
jgi:hypothetical protein